MKPRILTTIALRIGFLAIVLLPGFFATSLLAAPGDVDLFFDPGSGVDRTVYAITVQSDGKVILGGDFTTVRGLVRNRIARLNADGSGDTDFYPVTGANGIVYSVSVQLDGKVLIGGGFTTVNDVNRRGIARLNADGTLDAGFDPGMGASNVRSIALQPDGKVLIGGGFTTVNGVIRRGVARLNADGSLDSTFDPGTGATGGTDSSIQSVAIQGDGKILIGGGFFAVNGTTKYFVARMNADGALDAGFSPATVYPGFSVRYVSSVVAQPNGQVLIGGLFSVASGTRTIARLNADGSLDGGFNADTANSPEVNSVVLQPDSKVLIGGNFSVVNGVSRRQIARLNADGSSDNTFNLNLNAPAFPTVYVDAVALQPDGKVVMGGEFSDVVGTGRNRIERLNADGSLDTGFSAGGGANSSIYSVAAQSDGKVLIGGTFTSMGGANRRGLTRLNVDGSVDGSFDPGTGPNSAVYSVAAQTDGKVLIGGAFTSVNATSRNRIARVNADGSLDATFNPGTGADKAVRSIVVQTDGKVLIGGDFGSVNGASRSGVARLNANGSVDTSFDPGTGASCLFCSFVVNSVAVQPDGKVLIGGGFTSVHGTSRDRIARLNVDGSLDTSFNPGSYGLYVFTVAAQLDGKVLLGGNFAKAIARLNVDGSADMSFNPGTGVGGAVDSVAVQPDGKVLIGGAFTSVNGTSRNRIARLNADGSLDASFEPGAGANSEVRSVALQAGGWVLVGGDFTAVNAEARWRVARLEGTITGTGTDIAVLAVSPNKGGDAGFVTVRIRGENFPTDATVRLVLAGESDIVADPVDVESGGGFIMCTFDLHGKKRGTWDLTVAAPDGDPAFLDGAFTIEEGNAPDVWMDILGRSAVRVGREEIYTIVYGNRGNVDAVGVALWIAGIPTDATVRVLTELALPVPMADAEPVDWSQVAVAMEADADIRVPLVVTRVPPGSVNYVRVGITPKTSQPFDLHAWTNPPFFRSPFNPEAVACFKEVLLAGIELLAPVSAECLTAIGTVLLGPAIKHIESALTGNRTAKPTMFSAIQLLVQPLRVAMTCLGSVCVPCKQVKFIAKVWNYAFGGLGIAGPCSRVGRSAREVVTLPVRLVASQDPNEKIGSSGIGQSRFLSGAEPLRYAIFFENVETATAPAQDVVITDQVDVAKLDLSTFSFGPISFGEKIVIPEPELTGFHGEADLRPDTNLLVQVDAQVNANTGVITWQFRSIDPATGEPTTDPLAGFLPPNVHPPEGAGSVVYTVMPKAGLPTGTLVTNRAAIVFDVNAPILTGVWTNTLDNAKPSSHVLPLPATVCAGDFLVQWSGTDQGSGILDYTVLVADNGGLFEPWQLGVANSSETFAGQPGHTYSFKSLARDRTGNSEGAHASADATTTSSVDGMAPSIGPCPSSISTTVPPGTATAVVAFATPVTSDDCSTPTVVCDPPSGSSFAVGTTTVTCTATDDSDHASSCAFSVTVAQAIANTTPTVGAPTPSVTPSVTPATTGTTPTVAVTPVSVTVGATKCRTAIIGASAALLRSEAKVLSACAAKVVSGKLPPGTTCRTEPKTAGAIDKVRAKLIAVVAKKCGGKDKTCGTGNDDVPIAATGWAIGSCPNVEGGPCTNAISGCGDIATCLTCIGEAALDRAITLYYGNLMPTDPEDKAEKVLNKCQVAIGHSAASFLSAKSKALQKCWEAVSKGKAFGICPASDGKARAAIAKAEAKTINRICKACGGGGDKSPADGLCDTPSALTVTDIGFAGTCPADQVPGGDDCGLIGTVDTLDELIACVDCVTQSRVDCADVSAVPALAAYPDECKP